MTHRNIISSIGNEDEHIVKNAYTHNTVNIVVESIDQITNQSVNDLTLLGVKDIQH